MIVLLALSEIACVLVATVSYFVDGPADAAYFVAFAIYLYIRRRDMEKDK
jgi:hypothetical protein